MNEYVITFISGGYTQVSGANVLKAIDKLSETRMNDVETIKLMK